MSLTLLIPIRNRAAHFRVFNSWFPAAAADFPDDLDVIFVEADGAPNLQAEIESAGYRSLFVENSGIFHKTRALNRALEESRSTYVVPYDIDLVPYRKTLARHYLCARSCADCVVGGYRLNLPESTLDSNLDQILEAVSIDYLAPEDMPTALFKQLWHGERFVVLPFFERSRLIDIGGWDEGFQGWGAEDQDILERYLAERYFMLRSPEFLYFHLHHGYDAQHWKNDAIVVQNRKAYYAKRKRED
ncbi:MAG: glycosyltransferase family 2 protein [Chloroflexota bacterium]